MAGELSGRKVAILVCDGFEQVEMTEPRKALEAAGALVDLIAPMAEKVKGWKSKGWGDEFPVDLSLGSATASAYDALLLPGGVINADHLRAVPEARELVRMLFDEGKPVAAICHAAWILIDTDLVRGRTLTSWPTLRTDLTNAGAHWVDEEVVVDDGLVTSRKPGDIPAFNREMIRLFAEGRPVGHAETRKSA